MASAERPVIQRLSGLVGAAALTNLSRSRVNVGSDHLRFQPGDLVRPSPVSFDWDDRQVEPMGIIAWATWMGDPLTDDGELGVVWSVST